MVIEEYQNVVLLLPAHTHKTESIQVLYTLTNSIPSYNFPVIAHLYSRTCDLYHAPKVTAWTTNSTRTAKSFLCICKDVPDRLHNDERRNLRPPPTHTIPPNHSYKLQPIPPVNPFSPSCTCLLWHWNKCIKLAFNFKLAVFTLFSTKKRENHWLWYIFGFGNGFVFCFLVLVQIWIIVLDSKEKIKCKL